MGKLAYTGVHLLISDSPNTGGTMGTGKSKANQSVTKKHETVFKQGAEFHLPDSDSLEQPYAGEIVETVTTYDTAYGEPLDIEE